MMADVSSEEADMRRVVGDTLVRMSYRPNRT